MRPVPGRTSAKITCNGWGHCKRRNMLVKELQSSSPNPDIFPARLWGRNISDAETERIAGRIHNQGKYADQRYVLGA